MTYQAQKQRILFSVAFGMLVFTLTTALLPNRSNDDGMAVLLPKAVPEELVVSVAEEPSIDEAQFECMRTNIYHEAGDQSRRGMEAVALVTLNRTKTKGFPSSICEVVTARAKNKRGRWVCAFSWYCDGKSDAPNLTMTVKVGRKFQTVPNTMEIEAWETATAVARDAMEGKVHDFLGNATHYHANYVNPDWASAKRMHRLATVGTHLFYRDVLRKHKA